MFNDVMEIFTNRKKAISAQKKFNDANRHKYEHDNSIDQSDGIIQTIRNQSTNNIDFLLY